MGAAVDDFELDRIAYLLVVGYPERVTKEIAPAQAQATIDGGDICYGV